MNLRKMFDEITLALPEGGDWCSIGKANALASLVIALRPHVVVEVGVWMGGSALPMLIALRTLAEHDDPKQPRRLVAIDPWKSDASIADETVEANRKWWSTANHERAYQTFVARVAKHQARAHCEILRMGSDDAPIADTIDLCHIDGNHRDQAFRDVLRYGSRVRIGGYMILDDVKWDGGHVERAVDHAIGPGGFDLCYQLDMGLVLQKTRTPAAP